MTRAMFKFMVLPYGSLDAILAAFATAFFWCFGGLGTILGIILVLTVADFVTGYMRASCEGEVESSKVMRSAYKVAGYAILLLVLNVFFGNLIPHLVAVSPVIAGMIGDTFLYSLSAVPYIIGALIAIREMNSNIENLAAAGILPPWATAFLKRIFRQVRESLEKQNGRQQDSDSTN